MGRDGEVMDGMMDSEGGMGWDGMGWEEEERERTEGKGKGEDGCE